MVDTGQYAHPFFLAHGYDVTDLPTRWCPASTGPRPGGARHRRVRQPLRGRPPRHLEPFRAADDKGRLVAAIAGFLLAKPTSRSHLILLGGRLPAVPATRGSDPWRSSHGRWRSATRSKWESGRVLRGQRLLLRRAADPGRDRCRRRLCRPALSCSPRLHNRLLGRWFNRTVPTVCGLVGHSPRAAVHLLPVPPKCQIDMEGAQPSKVTRRTGRGRTTDGRCSRGPPPPHRRSRGPPRCSRGQGRPHPGEVVEALALTAMDVRAGFCHPRFNHPAGPGRDLATGYGLVNADRAVRHVLQA